MPTQTPCIVLRGSLDGSKHQQASMRSGAQGKAQKEGSDNLKEAVGFAAQAMQSRVK